MSKQEEGIQDDLIQKSTRVLRNKVSRFKKKEQEVKQKLEFTSTSELKTEYNDLKSIVESLEQAIQALESSQSSMSQKESTNQLAIKQHKEQVIKLTKEIKDRDAIINTLNSDVKKLNTELKSQNSSSDNIKKHISAQLTTIATLEKTVNNLEKSNDSLKESLNQKTHECKEKQDVIANFQNQTTKQMSSHQKRLEQTENQLVQSKHAFDHEKQLLMNRIQQLNQSLQEMEAEKRKWSDSIKKSERDSQNKYNALIKECEILTEKNKQLMMDSTKFEDEIIDYVKPNELVEFIRIVQILDFFDLSKPDSLKIRKLILNEKTREFTKMSDFHAFDYFCKLIKGSGKSMEENLKNGSVFISKLLGMSTDEVIYGVNFQKLHHQINELSMSSIFLNMKPITPMVDNIELKSEETVLSSLFRDKVDLKNTPQSPEPNWLNNPLYQRGGMDSEEETDKQGTKTGRGGRGSRRGTRGGPKNKK